MSAAGDGGGARANGNGSADYGGVPVTGRYVTGPNGERIFLLDRGSGASRGAATALAAPPPTAAALSPPAPPAATRGLAPPRAHARSDELEEMIAYAPNALVRWGISAIVAVLGALLALGWFIRYPVVVTGEVSVTTPTPPVRLVARAGGEVRRLLVRDGERVAAGADLALLAGPANYDHVRALRDRLARFARGGPAAEGVTADGFPTDLTLGEVQDAYAAFLQRLSDARSLDAGALYDARLASLRQEIAAHERLRVTLEQQHQTLVEHAGIAQQERARARELAARNLLAPAEVGRVDGEFLARRYAVEGSVSALRTNEVQLAARRGAMADLGQQRADDARTRALALGGAAAALREAIARWEQQYVLRAPVGGRVSFFRALAPGQFVAAAEPVLAVLPYSGEPLARVLLGDANAGRVRVGQRVMLRFDSYPTNEFGAVNGRVERISLLPNERRDGQTGEARVTHLVEVGLPDGLRTTFGRELEFRQEMRGVADVVTDDLRLLERVLHRFRELAARARGG